MNENDKNILHEVKILLLGDTYTILLSDNACHTYIDSCNLSERRINGFIDHPTKTIVINSDIDIIQKFQTLFHEITHAIIQQNNLNDIFQIQSHEEDICHSIGEGMVSLFKNNAPLIQKILNMTQEYK